MFYARVENAKEESGSTPLRVVNSSRTFSCMVPCMAILGGFMHDDDDDDDEDVDGAGNNDMGPPD